MAKVKTFNFNKKSYSLVLTNHVQDYRGNEKRIGNLDIFVIREFVRNSIIKNTDILNKTFDKFIITYPRENDCYSAILVVKENNTFVIVTIVHSNIKYQRQGLLPKEKKSIDFTEQETVKVFDNPRNEQKKKYVQKMPLRKPIKILRKVDK